MFDKGNKCKVVFIICFLDVCSEMDVYMKFKVEFLNEEGLWSFFCEKVGEVNIMELYIKFYVKEIVKKCGGLFFAFIIVGRVMVNRKTEEEWKYVIEVFNSVLLEF